MADKEKEQDTPVTGTEASPADENTQTEAQPQAQAEPEQEAPVEHEEAEELRKLKDELAAAEDKYLRLAAEYDNFRKRTTREKESAWSDSKAETALAFLSVYDNLERALKQTCADEAYAKGVEMTMTGLKDVLAKLGIEEIPALGETFDPNVHNAVMHVEDDSVEENTIVEVFQSGFRLGEKIMRFAMVKVAN